MTACAVGQGSDGPSNNHSLYSVLSRAQVCETPEAVLACTKRDFDTRNPAHLGKNPMHPRGACQVRETRCCCSCVPLQVLLTNTSLSRLYIRRCGVKAAGTKAIAAALHRHPALTNLDLAENPEVSAAGLQGFASSLQAWRRFELRTKSRRCNGLRVRES